VPECALEALQDKFLRRIFHSYLVLLRDLSFFVEISRVMKDGIMVMIGRDRSRDSHVEYAR
jgi:hypothetical protein